MSLLYKMNMQEMECCAHMSGDCDMDLNHKSCCQTISDPSSNVSHISNTVELPPLVLSADLPLTQRTVITADFVTITAANNGSPPGSPPGSITVLRI
jgi:hypothetical protein